MDVAARLRSPLSVRLKENLEALAELLPIRSQEAVPRLFGIYGLPNSRPPWTAAAPHTSGGALAVALAPGREPSDSRRVRPRRRASPSIRLSAES